jgi:hypothetical protein
MRTLAASGGPKKGKGAANGDAGKGPQRLVISYYLADQVDGQEMLSRLIN